MREISHGILDAQAFVIFTFWLHIVSNIEYVLLILEILLVMIIY
jgi:diacylglycerol kinase